MLLSMTQVHFYLELQHYLQIRSHGRGGVVAQRCSCSALSKFLMYKEETLWGSFSEDFLTCCHYLHLLYGWNWQKGEYRRSCWLAGWLIAAEDQLNLSPPFPAGIWPTEKQRGQLTCTSKRALCFWPGANQICLYINSREVAACWSQMKPKPSGTFKD